MPFSLATWQVAPSSFSGNLTGRYPYPSGPHPSPLRARFCFLSRFSGPPRFARRKTHRQISSRPSRNANSFRGNHRAMNRAFVARRKLYSPSNYDKHSKRIGNPQTTEPYTCIDNTPPRVGTPAHIQPLSTRPESAEPVSHSRPKEAAMAYRNFSKEFIERYEDDSRRRPHQSPSHKRGAGPSPGPPPRYVAPAAPSPPSCAILTKFCTWRPRQPLRGKNPGIQLRAQRRHKPPRAACAAGCPHGAHHFAHARPERRPHRGHSARARPGPHPLRPRGERILNGLYHADTGRFFNQNVHSVARARLPDTPATSRCKPSTASSATMEKAASTSFF